MSWEESDTLQFEYDNPLGSRLRKKDLNRLYSKWGTVETEEICPRPITSAPNASDCSIIFINMDAGQVLRRTNRDDVQSEEGLSILIEASKSIHGKITRPFERGWGWFNNAEKKPRHRSVEAGPKEGGITPDALIEKLESGTASHEEKRRAVIESEVVAFPSESVGTLNRLLYLFIKQYRDSEDQQDMVAVGSAIRKYVVTMNLGNLSALATLLDSEHNATVPIEVELEVAKTLVRKLVQSPPEEPNSEPRLADRLYEIVTLYLNPRLLSRDKFAAVALNAILALCLLRSSHADEVRQALEKAPESWFSELVLRRASQIREMLNETLSVEQAARCAEQLSALNGNIALGEG